MRTIFLHLVATWHRPVMAQMHNVITSFPTRLSKYRTAPRSYALSLFYVFNVWTTIAFHRV
jgi:hypothetical protein